MQARPDFTDAAVVAGRIQSTLISNTVTEGQWRRHISECIEYRFHARHDSWIMGAKDGRGAQGNGGKSRFIYRSPPWDDDEHR